MYNNLQYLSQVNATYYKSKKDYKKYSEWIEKQMAYRDSNDKYTRVQQIQHQQLEFDFERKHIADSLKFEQREKFKKRRITSSWWKIKPRAIIQSDVDGGAGDYRRVFGIYL